MGRVFNINAIYVTFAASLRVGVEACEGEVYFGPFESKDEARAWSEAFKPKLEGYWGNTYFKQTEGENLLPSLKDELQTGFHHGTDVALEIKWQTVGAIQRSRVNAVSQFALDPKHSSEQQLFLAVPAVLIKNVSANMLRFFG